MAAALSIKNLRKVYNNGFEALKGVSLEVQPGDFFGLLGPNGAGKSTTIGVICSLVQKTEGAVEIFGVDIDKDFSAAKQLIGVVPQEFNFNQFEKVFDIVVTQGGYYGMTRERSEQQAEKYLRKLGLWEKRDDASRMLSGGMKRRLMIARALVHEPQLLILDEPTAGVDIELRRSMWEFLQEINALGTTIILTTHYLEEAESLCRNLGIIDQGELVKNTSVKELLQQLHQETFVLDVSTALEQAPDLGEIPVRLIDSQSLEVDLGQEQPLNQVFDKLSQQGINVLSMRNKANRLEELFVHLVGGDIEGRKGEGGKQ